MRLTLAAVAAVAVSAPAWAATVNTFTDRTAFEAAAGTTASEDFNDFLTEDSFQTVPVDVGAFSLLGFGAQFDRNFIDVPPHLFSNFDVDGTTNVDALTGTDRGFTVTFASPVTAFGADFASLQDEVLRTTISVLDVTLIPPIQADDVIVFYGFVSDTPFTSIVFNGNEEGDGFSFDNVAFSIPEPATWALLLASFGSGAAMRRRAPLSS